MANFHNAAFVSLLALGLLALALMLAMGARFIQTWQRSRSSSAIDHALQQHRVAPHTAPEAADPTPKKRKSPLDRLARMGAGWASGHLGALLMADEDRALIERAGYAHSQQAQGLFPLIRVAASVILMGATLFGHPTSGPGHATSTVALWLLIGFGTGWMLPKWAVRRRVTRRLSAARAELPVLVDLLRLLQGVGLSVDQSLRIIADEFQDVMPILAQEVAWSLDMYMRGRTREQSLVRLSAHFDDDDLAAICKLLCQVDEHGGAVQAPLAHFGERLRDRRKLDLKAQVGKLTVKMTAVMVVTLLPALLIVTGGAGFVAILRGLSQVTS